MGQYSDADWRRERLQALVMHQDFGSKVALGRALGYLDGALIGQMLRGDRPITEKTIGRIAELRGGKYRDWFVREGQPQSVGEPRQMPKSWPFGKFISEQDWSELDEGQRSIVEFAAYKALQEVRAAGASGPPWKQTAA